jgi:hypothetical protein
MLAKGPAELSRSCITERWSQKNSVERADLVYQVATVAAAVLLVITAAAV